DPRHCAAHHRAAHGLRIPPALRARERTLRAGHPAHAPGSRSGAALRASARMSSASAPLLEVRELSKRFESKPDLASRLTRMRGAKPAARVVHAVDRVTLGFARGEVLGLVGESGCGKSTLGRMIVGVLEPSSGRIVYDGIDVTDRASAGAKQVALKIQMIFQDPFASLNPRMRIGEII